MSRKPEATSSSAASQADPPASSGPEHVTPAPALLPRPPVVVAERGECHCRPENPQAVGDDKPDIDHC